MLYLKCPVFENLHEKSPSLQMVRLNTHTYTHLHIHTLYFKEILNEKMLILYCLVNKLVINFHCKQRRLRLKNYFARKLGEGNQSKHTSSVQVILHLTKLE